jgi:hypothetical protein
MVSWYYQFVMTLLHTADLGNACGFVRSGRGCGELKQLLDVDNNPNSKGDITYPNFIYFLRFGTEGIGLNIEPVFVT